MQLLKSDGSGRHTESAYYFICRLDNGPAERDNGPTNFLNLSDGVSSAVRKPSESRSCQISKVQPNVSNKVSSATHAIGAPNRLCELKRKKFSLQLRRATSKPPKSNCESRPRNTTKPVRNESCTRIPPRGTSPVWPTPFEPRRAESNHAVISRERASS